MTAVTAHAAGVGAMLVASPRPTRVTRAAAHVAGAGALLAVGGAQAIAALAYGTETVPRVDVIAGPGNRWVTAAKQLVHGVAGIDMLAGPSELGHSGEADAHFLSLGRFAEPRLRRALTLLEDPARGLPLLRSIATRPDLAMSTGE